MPIGPTLLHNSPKTALDGKSIWVPVDQGSYFGTAYPLMDGDHVPSNLGCVMGLRSERSGHWTFKFSGVQVDSASSAKIQADAINAGATHVVALLADSQPTAEHIRDQVVSAYKK